jgi:hypothetical protein
MVLDLCLIFGILIPGCIHTHMNCKLEYIRLIFMCMLIYQMMVEGILRQGSINGCLIMAIEVFPREGS